MARKISHEAKLMGLTVATSSADDWFYFNGTYHWEDEQLDNAHRWSKGSFLLSLKEGVNVLVVDNENLREEEARFYIDAALEKKCNMYVIEWSCNAGDARLMADRSVHVPEGFDNVARYKRFQPIVVDRFEDIFISETDPEGLDDTRTNDVFTPMGYSFTNPIDGTTTGVDDVPNPRGRGTTRHTFYEHRSPYARASQHGSLTQDRAIVDPRGQAQPSRSSRTTTALQPRSSDQYPRSSHSSRSNPF
jgi:hypothetical protein